MRLVPRVIRIVNKSLREFRRIDSAGEKSIGLVRLGDPLCCLSELAPQKIKKYQLSKEYKVGLGYTDEQDEQL
jgi:hypothetical protein